MSVVHVHSAAFTRQEGGGHVLDISDDPMVDM